MVARTGLGCIVSACSSDKTKFWLLRGKNPSLTAHPLGAFCSLALPRRGGGRGFRGVSGSRGFTAVRIGQALLSSTTG